MIFKVFYQDTSKETPVRERTNSMYLEAESIRDVRAKLADRDMNIEFIQPIEGTFLEFEQKNQDFEVENL